MKSYLRSALYLSPLAAAAAVLALPIVTSGNGSYATEADVLGVEPVFSTVRVNTPREECRDVPVSVRTSYPQDTYTPEILGGIVGAGVGRLFGSGRGQDVATVAGAVLGGSLGRDYKRYRKADTGRVRYERRCETIDSYHSQEKLSGYDVTYRYDGIIYTARTDHDPGDTIRVNVDVSPAE